MYCVRLLHSAAFLRSPIRETELCDLHDTIHGQSTNLYPFIATIIKNALSDGDKTHAHHVTLLTTTPAFAHSEPRLSYNLTTILVFDLPFVLSFVLSKIKLGALVGCVRSMVTDL